MKERLSTNKRGWDRIADEWFGRTALPIYAPQMKTETELNLLGNLKGKKVLDIGCGSGHSLRYMGDQGASELWGLDISGAQIANAKNYLKDNGYKAQLFESPMEENPGIPENYFDVVYSIYAFGWTVDLKHTISLVSRYLKPNGIFVMSWDHPMLNCTTVEGDRLMIDKSYHKEALEYMRKSNEEMTFTRWNLSSYIRGFSRAGMYVEDLIEEVPKDILLGEFEDFDRYYSKKKAQLIPLSMIIKARKG